MRITLNLASRPFFELRPLLMRLRAIAAALVLLAIVLLFMLRRAEDKAERAEAAVHVWTVKTEMLQREWQYDEALMREPTNAATLSRSDFLNREFNRKSFSWTTAMMDLELVLPQGVQVISIDPRMGKDGLVLVRLRVSGPRDKALQLVSNLEKSPHFLNPRVAGETLQVHGENRTGFRPTMSSTTDDNVDIEVEFNGGDLAATDVKAEETKSGTHKAGSGKGSMKAGTVGKGASPKAGPSSRRPSRSVPTKKPAAAGGSAR
jgi:type IV pilus assembly protein PilN